MRILVNDYCGHASPIQLSQELARRGHQVLHTYFADNVSTPKGEIRSEVSSTSNLAIVGVHMSMKFEKLSVRTRRKADLAYGRAVAKEAMSFRPNIVVSANMPLDAQSILQRVSKDQDAKFIFWLQDVYSSAVQFVLKRKKLGPVALAAGAYYRWVEKRLLKESDAVVCICPEFARLVSSWGGDRSRIVVIANWGPLKEILPTGKDNTWAREHCADGKLCFMYSGTLGMKHRPELLLALARHLEVRGRGQLVVNAGGAGAEWLVENAGAIGEDVLKILPLQDYERLSEVMGASDVLIGLLDSDAGEFAVPSKVLSYLCAGRAIILAAPRENYAAFVVKTAGAGIVVSPDSSGDLVEAASHLMENADIRARYAANARTFAEKSFGITAIADRFLEVFAAS